MSIELLSRNELHQIFNCIWFQVSCVMLVDESFFSDLLIKSTAFVEEVSPSSLTSLVSSFYLIDYLLSLRLIKLNFFWNGGIPHLFNCVSCFGWAIYIIRAWMMLWWWKDFFFTCSPNAIIVTDRSLVKVNLLRIHFNGSLTNWISTTSIPTLLW